jgi:plastocyanin
MITRLILVAVALSLISGASAFGKEAGPGRATAADVARLQQQINELRQSQIQSMEVEQQRHDLVLKLLRSRAGVEAIPDPAAAPPLMGGPSAKANGVSPAPASPTTATVTGAVDVRGVPAGQPVYVYLDGRRAATPRGRSIEIVQKDKQFSPQVVAIQAGTAVAFPNHDSIGHNVYSLSARATFDLGILKAADHGNAVVLSEPGRVEIYCDIHERMWAEILVVPNSHFVKVSADGRFRLPGVPIGQRVIAAWTAGADPISRKVHVGPEGAEAHFNLAVPSRRAHNNKRGQPYGSYEE